MKMEDGTEYTRERFLEEDAERFTACFKGKDGHWHQDRGGGCGHCEHDKNYQPGLWCGVCVACMPSTRETGLFFKRVEPEHMPIIKKVPSWVDRPKVFVVDGAKAPSV